MDEIRGLIAQGGRAACTWEIGGSATPADLVQRLLAHGCEPDREPLAIGMVLTEPPEDDGTAVTARRALIDRFGESYCGIAPSAFQAGAFVPNQS